MCDIPTRDGRVFSNLATAFDAEQCNFTAIFLMNVKRCISLH